MEMDTQSEATETVAELSVNLSLFEITWTDVKLITELGRGGGGAVVYRGEWKGEDVAIKVFSSQNFSGENSNASEFEREVSMMGEFFIVAAFLLILLQGGAFRILISCVSMVWNFPCFLFANYRSGCSLCHPSVHLLACADHFLS